MRTITLENGKQVKISQESYDALDRELTIGDSVVVDIVQGGRWKPNNREDYWYVDMSAIRISFWGGSVTDNWNYSQRNVFKTKAEADKHLEYLKALAVLKDDAEDWEPDWSDGVEKKYFVIFEHSIRQLEVGCDNDTWYPKHPTQNPNQIYFKTKEQAQHSINTHEKEWLTVFGVER